MVRPGIGIYGVGHFERARSSACMDGFKTRISQVKRIRAGEPARLCMCRCNLKMREILPYYQLAMLMV